MTYLEEKRFNLLYEPWIKVLLPDLSEREVSLLELFENAHLYRSLSGETETQNAAILRLFLAITTTIIYRYDAEGNEDHITYDSDADEVIERWHEFWKLGKFPYDLYKKYLTKYENRFWLFHPEYPFYQNANLKYGTDYDLKNLYGDIKESNNHATAHLFSVHENLDEISYDEAARWLIWYQNYCVSAKKQQKDPDMPSDIKSDVGILAKLGFIYFNGKNLFETIMLNTVLLNGDEPFVDQPRPIWEKEPDNRQFVRIAPLNLPEYYTMQPRRFLFKEKDGLIISFYASIGETIDLSSDPIEPMTIWNEPPKNNLKIDAIAPKQHDLSQKMWQEFPVLFFSSLNIENNQRIPGIILWANTLEDNYPEDIAAQCNITAIGQTFTDKERFVYEEPYYDRLSMTFSLLNTYNQEWLDIIQDQVSKCKKISNLLTDCGKDISDFFNMQQNTIGDILKRNYFYHINTYFLKWLSDIDPATSDKIEESLKWEAQSSKTAKETLNNYFLTIPAHDLFQCKTIKKNKKEEKYALPNILNKYSNRIVYNIYKSQYPIFRKNTQGGDSINE